jgi:hypothetical protein
MPPFLVLCSSSSRSNLPRTTAFTEVAYPLPSMSARCLGWMALSSLAFPHNVAELETSLDSLLVIDRIRIEEKEHVSSDDLISSVNQLHLLRLLVSQDDE